MVKKEDMVKKENMDGDTMEENTIKKENSVSLLYLYYH